MGTLGLDVPEIRTLIIMTRPAEPQSPSPADPESPPDPDSLDIDPVDPRRRRDGADPDAPGRYSRGW